MTTSAVSQQPDIAVPPSLEDGQPSPVHADPSAWNAQSPAIDYISMPSPTSASSAPLMSPHAPVPSAPGASPRGSVPGPSGLRRAVSFNEQRELNDELGTRDADPSHKVRVTSGFYGFVNSRVLPTLTYISFWPPIITVSGSILLLSMRILQFSFELSLLIVLINVGVLLVSALSHIYVSARIQHNGFREARDENNGAYDREQAEGRNQAATLM